MARPRGRSARARGPALSSRVRIPAATPREVRCPTKARRLPRYRMQYGRSRPSSDGRKQGAVARSSAGGASSAAHRALRAARPPLGGATTVKVVERAFSCSKPSVPTGRQLAGVGPWPARRLARAAGDPSCARGTPVPPHPRRRDGRVGSPRQTGRVPRRRLGPAARFEEHVASLRTDQLRVPGSAHQARELQFLGDAPAAQRSR